MTNKICLVATYRELAELARKLKRELNLPIDVLEGSLEEGTRQALKAEKAGAKVIISRGGTASMIRRHVKIPVVEIRVTGYDVFRSIYPASGPGRVIGILGYQSAVIGCRPAAEILGISVHEKHEPVIVPFMAFTLGQNINLGSVLTAGIQGVVLGVVVLVVTGFVCILADKALGGSGIAGAAASSTAGNSAAVPKAVAMADPTYNAIAPIATVQVAASVIMTAILTPILTSWMYSKVQKERASQGTTGTNTPV